MPRPVKDDPRDRFKTFRFTEAEIARLHKQARASGRTLSSYVRTILLNGQGPDTASNGHDAAKRPAAAGPTRVRAFPRGKRAGFKTPLRNTTSWKNGLPSAAGATLPTSAANCPKRSRINWRSLRKMTA